MLRMSALFRHNIRLLLGDPAPIFLFLVTPLMVMAIMRPSMKTVLEVQGFQGVNGSEQIVPAFTVMFAFFWMPVIGRNFIVEHGWGTWDRLRASFATPGEVMIGKTAPAVFIILIQSVLLFTLGALIFDLDSAGPILTLALLAIPLVACVCSLTLAIVGICSTLSQMDATGNMFTMVFAALGGSLVPASTLPGWAETIGPATPNYWFNEASRRVLLEGDGISAVLVSSGVMLGFTALFAVVTVVTFRYGATKYAT